MADARDPVAATRFAGQFVLRRKTASGVVREDFTRLELPGDYELLAQGDAPVHSAVRHAHLATVGTLLDPRAPGLTDQQVVDQLAGCRTFDELEERLAPLGGRWLLFASIAGRARLYPDAAGSRAVFYAPSGDGVMAASQPGLLEEEGSARARPELLAKLWASPAADVWPAVFTPYEGARQLLPNHYLDVARGCARRFWPSTEVEAVHPEDAACGFADTLTGTFRAMSRRGGAINLPLTGGIDSRMLLACAREVRGDLRCFTVVDTATPLHDLFLPLRLATKLGLNFRFVRAHADAHSDEVLRQNTGGVWRDPHEHRISAFRAPGVHAVGTVSEVCRCYYYPDGEHPARVDGALLSRLAGWGDERLAISAFDDWLAGVPSCNVKTLDLFYWECRLGNWAALDAMALDGYAESLSPFNCRALLEMGLGVSAEQRRAPYLLQRRVCDLAAPELHGVPVNQTWLGRWSRRASSSVPAGVRKSLKQARRRIAGAPLRAGDA